MINQLCSNFFQDWGLLIILIVFLVFILVYSATKRKKDAKTAEEFANNLRVGDKIKTYSGVYGKIISIKDTPNGKIAVIETGEGKNVSYMSVDVYAIYNIESPVQDKKQNSENKVIEKNEIKNSETEKTEEKTTDEESKDKNLEDKTEEKDKKENKNKKVEESTFEKLKAEENK